MKNFPNQFARASKIRETLDLIWVLGDDEGDVLDDGVLGYEMARNGIYAFRGLTTSLEDRIRLEQEKPRGSQGARTAAREMRRTLGGLGWVDEEGVLTSDGEAVLATDVDSPEERALWQAALDRLSVRDEDGHTSHPTRILLRLVDDRRFESRDGMELALEARDDSPEEFARVREMLSLDAVDRHQRLGVGQTKVDNSVKVIPSLALQAGLLARRDGSFIVTEDGRALVGLPAQPGGAKAPNAGERKPHNRSRRSGGRGKPVDATTAGKDREFNQDGWSSLSREEQLDAIRRRSERTDSHQNLVRALASRVSGSLQEDPASFDLLSEHPGEVAVIWEVKTIRTDESIRTRDAAGQLLFYEHFFVRPKRESWRLLKAVVYDDEVSEDLCQFLQELGIGAFSFRDDVVTALNEASAEIVAVALS